MKKKLSHCIIYAFIISSFDTNLTQYLKCLISFHITSVNVMIKFQAFLQVENVGYFKNNHQRMYRNLGTQNNT